MSITLSAPPAIVQDVRIYAEKHATSLNALIREHLEFIAAKERNARKKEADKLMDFFCRYYRAPRFGGGGRDGFCCGKIVATDKM